ncbi:MAG: hypothetical protein CM15mV25_0970 [uncultured marine virus]|nr:MAG: hypothetical protein CM15mV25_0970 [uncultured marine virus]
MLIDKINMFYKSSKRLPIFFSTMDNIWIKQVNALKTFKDVVELAKKMLNWQKKEIDKQKENGSLSDSIDKLYKLSDDHLMLKKTKITIQMATIQIQIKKMTLRKKVMVTLVM